MTPKRQYLFNQFLHSGVIRLAMDNPMSVSSRTMVEEVSFIKVSLMYAISEYSY